MLTLPGFRSLSNLLIMATIVFGTGAATADTTQVIYNFKSGTDGRSPDSNLIADKNGNLYGTTSVGGMASGQGYGVVFEVSPATGGGGGWTEAVLYSFQGANDGAYPWAGLVFDSQGNLYGTTTGGGGSLSCTGGCGTVFELSPPTVSGASWTETVLYSFLGGVDGSTPRAGVMFDNAGNLYGTTSSGGASSLGTVFELNAPLFAGAQWTESILHNFTGKGDGYKPWSGLVQGKGGVLYGTTPDDGMSGGGTIYRLVPVGDAWSFQSVYAFKGGSDGAEALGTLLLDKTGNLYGSTVTGGQGFGTIFELMLPSENSPVREAILYRFAGGTDGAYPIGEVVFDAAGNLYGTTNEGGGGSKLGSGIVYRLTPPAAPGATWTETILHNFGGAQGSNPNAGLVFGKAGSLYGTATNNGANNVGVVFKTRVPPQE
jgi:uncharacterized repeat protein (TIGR03803 family)